MPNFKKNKGRGFKMSRNAGNPFNFGEGTGNPLKHDPDGYYKDKAYADAEKVKETARKNPVPVTEGDGVDEPQSVTQARRNAKTETKAEPTSDKKPKNEDWRFKEGYQGGYDDKGEKTWTRPDGSKDHTYGSPHNTTWENIGIKAREWDEKSSNWLRGLWS